MISQALGLGDRFGQGGQELNFVYIRLVHHETVKLVFVIRMGFKNDSETVLTIWNFQSIIDIQVYVNFILYMLKSIMILLSVEKTLLKH